ncbi:MAG: SIMPL domain-containing protein [Idiomarina sp.]|nr:SIMPL domain-containing protein [Idiomarina sp.]
MYRIIFAAINALVLVLGMSAAQASSLPDFPFVTVTGQSEREVTPDMGVLNFSVTSFDAESEVASEQLAATTREILAALRAHEVPDSAITSYAIDKNIRRERDSQHRETHIIGYEFSRRFEIRLSSLERYAELVTALMNINRLGNINSRFDYSQRETVELALIAEAATQARTRANQMATGLGVQIDSVFAFNDTGSFTNFFATFGLQGGHYGVDRMQTMSSRSDQPLFIPQAMTISKTVNVIYKVKP